MSVDWTVCRDRAGHLLSATEISTAMHLTGPRAGIQIHVDRLDEFGPLVPILDADGLPVVRTVGDLTARHIGRRVRVDGWFEGALRELSASDQPDEVDLTVLGDGEIRYGCIPLDTPCEVLP